MKLISSILAFVVLMLVATPARTAGGPSLTCVVRSCSKTTDRPHNWIGFHLSAGIPAGGHVGVAVSPYFDWLTLTGGYTNNYYVSGGKFGLTLDPIELMIVPTLTAEYGFTGKFDASTLLEANVPSASYEYVNIHPGIEIGRRNTFRFFLRGGATHIWARTYDFGNSYDVERLRVSDPRARVWLGGTLTIGFTMMVF